MAPDFRRQGEVSQQDTGPHIAGRSVNGPGAVFPGVTASGPQMRAAASGMSLGDSVYERLLQQRIIVLGQQVDSEISNRIAAQMLLLAAEDPEQDIQLYINSPGGSVNDGMAVFDTMNLVPCDVATTVMGMAASMGQFLLSAGTPGKRSALPHAKIMMHQPSGGIGGTEADITILADQLRKTKLEMAELIAGHTGQSIETITRDSDRDRWFSAAEAKDYGFVDHVVTHAGRISTTSPNGSA